MFDAKTLREKFHFLYEKLLQHPVTILAKIRISQIFLRSYVICSFNILKKNYKSHLPATKYVLEIYQRYTSSSASLGVNYLSNWWLQFQQLLEQKWEDVIKLTVRRYLLPRVWRIHEGSILDLLINVFILIKRERATQADINYNAHTPHVQWPVVTLVP